MKIDKETYNELVSGYSYNGFEVVENGNWVVEHKYEEKRVIVKHEDSGRYFALYESRSGSYFSHYEYEEYDTDEDGMIELVEVKPVETTIIKYVIA